MNSCVSELPIGEILVRAGLVNQSQMDAAIKEAGTRARLLGKTLVARGVLTPENLRAALEAQSLLRDGVVDSSEAFKALSIASSAGLTFEQALAPDDAKKRPKKICPLITSKLGKLLLAAGVLEAPVLARAQKKVLSTGEPLGVVLVSEGLLSESFLDAALELQVRVRDGMFSREQAIFALQQDPRKLLDMIAPHMMADEAQAKKPEAAIRVGELLVRAGIISNADVNQALELSLAHGHPIGEMLVARGFITRPLLDATLALQQMTTLAHLSTGEATACLIKVFTTDKTVSECILELNSLKSKPALRQAQKFQKKNTLSGQDPSDTSTDLPAMSVRDRQAPVESEPVELFQSVAPGQDLEAKTGQKVSDMAEKIRQIQLDTEELRNLIPEDETGFESFEPSEDEIAAATRFEEFFGANFAFVKDHRESFYRGLREAYARLGRVFLKRRQLGQSEDLLKSAPGSSPIRPIWKTKKVEDLMFLACLYLAHGKSWQAERLLKSCLSILEGREAVNGKLVGLCHHRMALVYCHLSLLFKAERHFKRAIALLCDDPAARLSTAESALTKRRLAAVYRDYAVLLNRMRREQEADRLYSQARKILASSLRTG